MENVNPMEARQRRMELRRQSTSKSVQKRYHDDDTVDNEDDRSVSSATSKDICTTSSFSVTASMNRNKKQKCSEVTTSSAEVDLSIYRGIKKQARYEPTIPIGSKAELAAWRKEARRIRNRESAAASRNKTRERIDELEGQLRTAQNQHSTALQRIAELESLLAQHIQCDSTVSLPQASSPKDSTTNHVSPVLLPSKSAVSPTELDIAATLDDNNESTEDTEPLIWSPDHQSAAEALAKSLMYDISPSDSMTIPNVVAPDQFPQSSLSTSCVSNNTNIESITSLASTNGLNTNHQNIKISRPTAVCVVPI